MCLSKYALSQGAGLSMTGYEYNTYGVSGSLLWTVGFSVFTGGGNVYDSKSGRNRDAYQQRRMCLYNYVADNGYVNTTSVGYSYSGWFSIGSQVNRVRAEYSSSCPYYS
jgi:hypothetical protein